ncbi:hypothetical protein NC651_014471 [Populus alba x Populus x berolinensis]|nr:hypothetical protein NC651_014471 [Populus alba x Populus x berolinensis]
MVPQGTRSTCLLNSTSMYFGVHCINIPENLSVVIYNLTTKHFPHGLIFHVHNQLNSWLFLWTLPCACKELGANPLGQIPKRHAQSHSISRFLAWDFSNRTIYLALECVYPIFLILATENPLLQNRFFAGMAASTEAILLITTQSTRIAISTVHRLKINCLRFISSSSCPFQNYVALSFPGGENLNVFPSIHRSSFLALILCCCWDPKDMNSQLFSLLFIEITIEKEIYIY